MSITRDQVLQALQPIFRDVLDDDTIVVDFSSNAGNTPNWDSLAHINLIEIVQSEFRVKFALGEVQDLKVVGDLVDLIIKKQGSAKK